MFSAALQNAIFSRRLAVEAVDPLAASVVLYARFNGTNGSTTLVDESIVGRTLTAVGDAQLSTSSPLRGASSLLLAGAGYVDIAASASLDLGTNPFCVEFLINTSTFSLDGGVQRTVLALGNYNDAAGLAICFYAGAASSNISVFTNAQIVTGTIPAADGSTHHVALDRSGTTMKLFVDGVQSASVSNSQNYNSAASNAARIGAGRFDNASGRLIGKLDELKITRASRYQSAFTPP